MYLSFVRLHQIKYNRRSCVNTFTHPRQPAFRPPPNHSSTCLLHAPIAHAFTSLPTHGPINSSTHSLALSLAHSLTHSLTYSVPLAFTHACITHALTHAFMHLLFHPLTHVAQPTHLQDHPRGLAHVQRGGQNAGGKRLSSGQHAPGLGAALERRGDAATPQTQNQGHQGCAGKGCPLVLHYH